MVPVGAVPFGQPVKKAHPLFNEKLQLPGFQFKSRDHKDPKDQGKQQYHAGHRKSGDQCRIDLQSEKTDLIDVMQHGVPHSEADRLFLFIFSLQKDDPHQQDHGNDQKERKGMYPFSLIQIPTS